MATFTQPTIPDVIPWRPSESPASDTEASSCTICFEEGPGVRLWSLPAAAQRSATGIQVQLRLLPDAPAIIGRADGGCIEYLDPRYTPTPIVPGTGKTILRHAGSGRDLFVSRGHFMLRSHPCGVVLVNGVPGRGGGIRPPRNWTEMLAPCCRRLLPAEELLIEHGAQLQIRLPNETRLTIQSS